MIITFLQLATTCYSLLQLSSMSTNPLLEKTVFKFEFTQSAKNLHSLDADFLPLNRPDLNFPSLSSFIFKADFFEISDNIDPSAIVIKLDTLKKDDGWMGGGTFKTVQNKVIRMYKQRTSFIYQNGVYILDVSKDENYSFDFAVDRFQMEVNFAAASNSKESFIRLYYDLYPKKE